MMMNKKISMLVLVSVLMLVLSSGLAAQDRAPVTLTLYNMWGGDRVPLMETQLERFMEKYPWITVINEVGGHDLLEEQALLAIASGESPDVLMVDRLNIPMFVESGLITPLDRYIEQTGLDLSMFYAAELETCQYRGSVYALPLPSASLSLLYYNANMFEEVGLNPANPPETWNEMIEYSRKLHREDSQGDVIVSGGNMGYFPRHRIAQLAYLNDADIFKAGDDVDYLGPEVLEAAEWITEYVDRVPPSGSLAAGTLAMQTQGEWTYFQLRRQAPDLDIAIGLVPHGPRGEYKNLVAAAWSYGIPAGVDHPYESWLLVEFLTTSPDGAGYFTLEQARPSPVREFTLNPEYWDLNPYWDVIGEALSKSVTAPPSTAARDIINADIRWWNVLLSRQQSPGAVLEQLQREVETILADHAR